MKLSQVCVYFVQMQKTSKFSILFSFSSNSLSYLLLIVKLIEKKSIPDEMRHLIEHEYNILRLLNHPGVINLLHVKEDAEYIYLFMPMYRGGDLHSYLDNFDYLTERDAFRLFYQVCVCVWCVFLC